MAANGVSDHEHMKIAIIGGGIAGACLINGLLKHPRFNVHLYEAAPTFTERGANVGISANGQKMLEVLGLEVRQALTRAGAVMNSPSARLMLAKGPDAMKHVWDIDHGSGKTQYTVHRASFLDQLLKLVPEEYLHLNKKLAKIVEQDESVAVHFTDGTSEAFDAVIGADGIHSAVRKYLLGPDHPAAKPIYSGFYHYFFVVSKEDAAAAIGHGYFKEATQYGWVGEGGFLIHDQCEDGKKAQILGCFRDGKPWEHERWILPADAEHVRRDFADWGHIGKAISELLLRNPDLTIWSIWELPPAPFYNKGRVCMMGDAAHAFQPWQGSGASMAIEDAAMLTNLLSNAQSALQAPAALDTFDQVRRPRTQAVGKSSAETGLIVVGLGEGVPLERGSLKKALEHRWDFIWDLNIEEHLDDGIKLMNKSLENQTTAAG